jgi:hypothetical protein
MVEPRDKLCARPRGDEDGSAPGGAGAGTPGRLANSPPGGESSARPAAAGVPAAGGIPPAGSAAARASRLAACLVALLVTMPGPASSLDGGVDGSWRWAINVLPTAEIRFGDVVFPYGPLGFVLLPAYAGGKAAWALAAQWTLHALFGLALWRLLRGWSAARGWLLAVAVVLAHAAGLVYESQLTVCVLALLAPAALGVSRARWPAAAAGALAGLALLAKLSLGVTALAVTAALALPAERTRRRLAATALAAAALSFLAAGGLAFRSPGRAWRWWQGSGEVAAGFAESMSVGGNMGRWWIAVAGLALFGALAGWLSVRRDPLRHLAWLGAPAVVLAFAHATTRLDSEHARLFAPLLLVVFALLLAAARGRAALMACGVAALVWTGFVAPQVGATSPRSRGAVVIGDASRRVRAALQPRRAAAHAARRSAAALAPLRLEAAWIADWRASATTVDALPLRLGYLPANGLRWRPNPTLQLFAAMTPALDRRAAAHFCGAAGPQRLLVRFEDIDGRNMVWDTPLTWQAIAACYEPDPAAGAAGPPGSRRVRALRRREQAAVWEWRALGRVEAPAGEWLPVPAGDGVVVAGLRLERSALGRLAGVLLPVPPVWLEAELTSGRRERWRVVRRTAAAGLQVAPLPDQLRHLNAWWGGADLPERRASRLRWLAETSPWAYGGRATLDFRAGRLAPLTPPATPRSAAAATP